MQNAPRRAKKCEKCVAPTQAVRAVAQKLAALKVAAVHSRQAQPRCSRSSTKTATANSAKTNSWKWPRPSVNTCGGPADREVRMVRDSKVADRVALKDTHDSRGAGRQVHPWAHASKVVAAMIAVLPAAPKVAASNAAASMVHRHDVVTIASALQDRPKVVATNANAMHVGPKVVDLSANASLARAAVNSNAIVMQVHHADADTIVTASPDRPIAGVSNVTATHAAQKENDMNAIGMPLLRVDPEWIAIVWLDHRANTAAMTIVSLVRPSVATSMARGLIIHHVLRSIHV
jgi:hypothetical protein